MGFLLQFYRRVRYLLTALFIRVPATTPFWATISCWNYLNNGNSCRIYSVFHVRFEAFTAVTAKNVVFWDVTPYVSCKKFFRSVLQLLVTANVPSSPILVTLMVRDIRSSETLMFPRDTRRHIPEDGMLHVMFLFLAHTAYSYRARRELGGEMGHWGLCHHSGSRSSISSPKSGLTKNGRRGNMESCILFVCHGSVLLGRFAIQKPPLPRKGWQGLGSRPANRGRWMFRFRMYATIHAYLAEQQYIPTLGRTAPFPLGLSSLGDGVLYLVCRPETTKYLSDTIRSHFTLCFTGNILHFGYQAQPVNVLWKIGHCFLSELRGTYRYNLCAESWITVSSQLYGGGLEYLHRSPASGKRWQEGTQCPGVWQGQSPMREQGWYWVLSDLDQRLVAMQTTWARVGVCCKVRVVGVSVPEARVTVQEPRACWTSAAGSLEAATKQRQCL
jgi:hypothetical protein